MEDNVLQFIPAYRAKCQHRKTYSINEGEAFVKCGECGESLDPMAVLLALSKKESHYNIRIQKLNEQAAKLADRNRTKCQHCDKMTAILK